MHLQAGNVPGVVGRVCGVLLRDAQFAWPLDTCKRLVGELPEHLRVRRRVRQRPKLVRRKCEDALDHAGVGLGGSMSLAPAGRADEGGRIPFGRLPGELGALGHGALGRSASGRFDLRSPRPRRVEYRRDLGIALLIECPQDVLNRHRVSLGDRPVNALPPCDGTSITGRCRS